MRSENLPIDVLLAGLGLAWAGLIGALVWPVPALHAPLQFFMYLLAFSAAILVLSPRYRALVVSPLFLLGLLSCLFFTIPPWVWTHISIESMLATAPDRTAAIRRFVDGTGQLVVQQFSALALLTSLALARFRPTGRPAATSPMPVIDLGAHSAKFAAGAIVAILGGAVFIACQYFPAAGGWWGGGRAGLQLLFAAGPLIAIGVVTLIALAIGRPPGWTVLAAVGLAVGCAALLLTFAAKLSVFLALASLAYFVAHRRLPRRGLVVACAGVAVILVIVLTVLTVMRYGTPYGRGVGMLASWTLQGKLLLRQADTGGCFQSAAEQALPHGNSESPFYFVAVFVPRLLWRDKPGFSHGNDYARAYCGFEPDARHSASITLLGQPVVRAGWAGLAVAEATLIVGLSAVTLLADRRRPAGPIALAALLPWLIDFDQDFALYVGNAVKMFLWMLPLLIPMVVIASRADSARAGKK